MNLTFIELLTHGRHNMDFRLRRIFNNVSGKSLSFIKSIFCGGAYCCLEFQGHKPAESEICNFKSEDLFLLAEFCYETNVTVWSLTFLMCRMRTIMPSLQGLIEITSENMGTVFIVFPSCSNTADLLLFNLICDRCILKFIVLGLTQR